MKEKKRTFIVCDHVLDIVVFFSVRNVKIQMQRRIHINNKDIHEEPMTMKRRTGHEIDMIRFVIASW